MPLVNLITTPTGQIGGKLLERLAERQVPLRVVARDPALPDLRDGVEVVEGSHRDPSTLDRALAGAGCVFLVVPPDFTAEDVDRHYRSFATAMGEGIVRHAVPRAIGVTSLGRNWPGAAGNLSAAMAMDELIEATGVAYRALSMPYFMENLLSQAAVIRDAGRFFMPNDVDRPLATVAVRDVAAVAAELLLDETWTGQAIVPVIGPDDLTPTGMAGVMSEVLDQTITVQPMGADAFRRMLTQRGSSDAWAQGLLDMVAAQDAGIYDEPARNASRAPTSFRQWCEDVLAPAVTAGA